MKPMMLFLAATVLASSAVEALSFPRYVPSFSGERYRNLSVYDPDTQLEIKNVELGLVIDVPYVSVPGKDLVTQSSNGEADQLFKLIKDSRGSYRIINPYSGLYLQSLSSTTLVHLGNESTHRRSLWIFQEAGKNTYTIQNADSKLYMEPVRDRHGGDIYILSLKQRNDTYSQFWMLEIISPAPII